MIIRPYHEEDLQEIAQLFYDTVHSVNAKDYTGQQLDVWATGEIDRSAWNLSLRFPEKGDCRCDLLVA